MKAAAAAKPTRLVSMRLPNSMTPCVLSSVYSEVSVHFGHVGQPSPEPVTRTATPVTTMSVNMTSAMRVKSA